MTLSLQIYDGSSLDEVKMDVNTPLHSAQRWENVGYMCYVIPTSNSSKDALIWYTMEVAYIIIPFPVKVKLWQTQYMYGTIG